MTATTPERHEITGDRGVDRIIEGVVGIFGQAFPGRIRAVYLRGSHASGSSTAGSDIDLFVVFEDGFGDRDEHEAAQAVCRHCALLTSVMLEIIPLSEEQLHDERQLAIALALKLGTRLVSGTDIRPELPELDSTRYVRSVVHTPCYSYIFPEKRRQAGVLSYPLEHLEAEGPFFGYDQWLMPGPDGVEVPSTKLLVASVGWTATALIALRTRKYVSDKANCVELYQSDVADEWTELVVDVHEHCRNRWRYRVPDSVADRRTLRELCARALPFQNHYLERYRGYQLDELRSGDPDRQRLAARRLQVVVFPDDEVRAALQAAGV